MLVTCVKVGSRSGVKGLTSHIEELLQNGEDILVEGIGKQAVMNAVIALTLVCENHPGLSFRLSRRQDEKEPERTVTQFNLVEFEE